MACRICGRSSCTESFHSLEEQIEFEDHNHGECGADPRECRFCDAEAEDEYPPKEEHGK